MTSVSEKYFHLKQSVFHISFVRDFFCLFSKKAEGFVWVQTALQVLFSDKSYDKNCTVNYV